MMFAFSTDGEMYHGHFETREAAIAAAQQHGSKEYWVGSCARPTPPEDLWNADDWLEHVSVQDDYAGYWAENWDESTKEQRGELETEVREVMARWLDRHNLRPDFHNIIDEQPYCETDTQLAQAQDHPAD